MLLLDNVRDGGEDPESALALTSIWRLAGAEESCEKLRPLLVFSLVLTRNLANGIADFVADSLSLFGAQALEKLRADSIALSRLQRDKVLLGGLRSRDFSSACCNAAEEDGGEGTILIGKAVSVASLAVRRERVCVHKRTVAS